MKKRLKKKVPYRKHRRLKLSRGRGSIYIIFLLFLLAFLGFNFVNGLGNTKSFYSNGNPNGQKVIIVNPTDTSKKDNLQLKTLGFITPTPNIECQGTVAVDLLVDRSGSMATARLRTADGRLKIVALRDALIYFTSQFTDELVAGMQSFADPPSTADVRIDLYANNKSELLAEINRLPSRAGGITWMKDGMQLAKREIEAAKARYPDKTFSLIMLTDGVPNPPGTQNPLTPENIAAQIKAMGVTIYTIGILGESESSDRELNALLAQIATSPAHYKTSYNGNNLELIYNEIGQKICQ